MTKYLLKSTKQANNDFIFRKKMYKPCNSDYGNNRFENIRQQSFSSSYLFNLMLNPVVCKDKNGIYLFVNRAFEKLVGIPGKEIIGLTNAEVNNNFYEHNEGSPAIDEGYFQKAAREWDQIDMEIIRSEGARSLEKEIVCADGIKRVFIVNFSTFNKENGGVQGLVIVLQDITEYQKPKNAFENDEKYRIAAEQTGQLVCDFNLLADKGRWAGEIERITGYSKEEFQGMSRNLWIENIHPADRNVVLKKFIETRKTGESYQVEFRFRKKDGTFIYLEVNGIYLTNRREMPVRLLGTIKDITGRKLAEETLAQVEIARKKEVHHRIKNNLQVIYSLLDLQAENLEDEKIKKVLRESQNRIMSIALIHKELYMDGEMDNVNFSTYIRELAENLLDTYKVGDLDISLCIDLEKNIFFNVETAVPLGIIINEIFSNSLKYAFPDKTCGEIRISLVRKKIGESERKKIENTEPDFLNKEKKQSIENGTNFILTVSDNGVGIPRNFNICANDTLGLQLINILVEQLNGSIRLNRNKGTEFIIEFAAQDYGR